jgi:hypothetical protein
MLGRPTEALGNSLQQVGGVENLARTMRLSYDGVSGSWAGRREPSSSGTHDASRSSLHPFSFLDMKIYTWR